jgi:hypothetical protein
MKFRIPVVTLIIIVVSLPLARLLHQSWRLITVTGLALFLISGWAEGRGNHRDGLDPPDPPQ